ncbi:hypothetical protein QUA71_19640 [Microcoleus sp. MON1_C5]
MVKASGGRSTSSGKGSSSGTTPKRTTEQGREAAAKGAIREEF